MEVWKDIPGYEGLYQASSLGRIKALKKVRSIGGRCNMRSYPEKVMHLRKLPKKKYLYVTLCKNGQARSHTVHRLIALTHVPNPNNFPVVDHLDTDTFNNAASNLAWTTYAENSRRAYINGLQPSAFGNPGVFNPSEKIVLDEQTGVFYNSIVEAANYSRFSIRSLYHQFAGDSIKRTSLKIV